VPPELYAMIQKVVPRSLELTMKGAPPLGGRTGEMRAYVAELKSVAGAERLTAQLALQGLSRTQVKAVVEALIRHLQDTQGIQAAETLLQSLPGLSRLLA
jgi:hypothetical protein